MAAKRVAIIDFGSTKITGIVGEEGINTQLVLHTKVEYNYDGYINGKFLAEPSLKELLGQIVDDMEKNTGLTFKKLYVGVPAEFVAVKVGQAKNAFLKAKRLTYKIVGNLCSIATAGYVNEEYTEIDKRMLDFVLDEVKKEARPVEKTAKRISTSISFMYAETYFIELIAGALADVGIEEVDFVSSTLAENIYILDDDERETDKVVVNIGERNSCVSVTRGEGLTRIAGFSMGSENITHDLIEFLKGEEGLELDFVAAENLKKKVLLSVMVDEKAIYSVEGQTKFFEVPADLANQIVKWRLDKIGETITQSLKSFGISHKNTKTIYITGAGICYIKGAIDYLSKMLAYPIEIKPAKQLRTPKPELASELGMVRIAIESEKYIG